MCRGVAETQVRNQRVRQKEESINLSEEYYEEKVRRMNKMYDLRT